MIENACVDVDVGGGGSGVIEKVGVAGGGGSGGDGRIMVFVQQSRAADRKDFPPVADPTRTK